jgi:hypothetical protein
MDEYLSKIRIPIDKIPEAKDWKVGGKYRLNAVVEMTGINKERDYRSDYDDGPVAISKRDKKPKFKTMVEFKVSDVSGPKDKAIKKHMD